MDVGGAFPQLDAVIVKSHGLVHHVGREVLDDSLAFMYAVHNVIPLTWRDGWGSMDMFGQLAPIHGGDLARKCGLQLRPL